jgi:hypothetical protein
MKLILETQTSPPHLYNIKDTIFRCFEKKTRVNDSQYNKKHKKLCNDFEDHIVYNVYIV